MDDDGKEYDLTAEPVARGEYSPQATREPIESQVQMWLAFMLIGLIALIVLTSCVVFAVGSLWLGKVDLPSIKDFALAMLGPLGGLAGTVLGFYYGERRITPGRRRP